jgi:hypothetical protein
VEGNYGRPEHCDVISSLTLDEKESVKQFVEFLKRKGSSPPLPFLAAVDEFIDRHPELLRRLAPSRCTLGELVPESCVRRRQQARRGDGPGGIPVRERLSPRVR